MTDIEPDRVIAARGLTTLYGNHRAVDAIDLDIRRGEIFGRSRSARRSAAGEIPGRPRDLCGGAGGAMADRVRRWPAAAGCAAVQDLAMGLMRLSPGTLFGEAAAGLLSPETRTLGPTLPAQMRGAVLGAPLPFGQSLLLIWPQITGLIACMIVVFAAAFVVFQREEVRA